MFSPSKENNREDHLRKGAEVSPWESVVAGSMSGAVSRAITAPLDTVKIRLQIQTANIGNYNGVWKTSKSILRNEGIKAFWKGNVPAEIMYILYGAVQFTSYTAISKMLTTFQKNNKLLLLSPAIHSLVVGAGAGITSTIVTYPFDLLRTRLAANRHRKILSMIETIKSIKEADGILGFFIGIRPALLSVASNTGLMFWTYELAREFTSKYNGIPFIEGICGFIAGATAKGITFPLDTLRKRIQVKSLENSNHLYKLSKQIIQQEGLFGLYKGYGISVFKTAPTSALSIFIYEYTISMVRKV